MRGNNLPEKMAKRGLLFIESGTADPGERVE